MDCGLNETNSPVLGGAPGLYGFHPPPRTHPVRKWRHCPVPSLQFPIMAKLGIKFFVRTPGASVSFRFIFLLYLVSSGFSFKSSLINHPHRPSLAKSECAERWKHSISPKVINILIHEISQYQDLISLAGQIVKLWGQVIRNRIIRGHKHESRQITKL